MFHKGAIAAGLDEFKVENNNGKTKVSIRVSWMAYFDKQNNKAEYNRAWFSTTNQYIIERIMSLNLPQGQQPNNTQKIFLLIPYKNLSWKMWNSNGNTGVTGFGDIDGEVGFYQPPPPRSQNNQNNQSGYNNQGGAPQSGYGGAPLGGYGGAPQGGYGGAPLGGYGGAPQGGYQQGNPPGYGQGGAPQGAPQSSYPQATNGPFNNQPTGLNQGPQGPQGSFGGQAPSSYYGGDDPYQG